MLENSSGSLYPAIRVLADENINIMALTIADTDRYGILRIIVNQTQKAVEVLKRSGYVVKITEIICVAMKDRPGSFAKVLNLLEDNHAGLEYVYVLGKAGDGNIQMLLRATDNESTERLLEENGYTLLKEE